IKVLPWALLGTISPFRSTATFLPLQSSLASSAATSSGPSKRWAPPLTVTLIMETIIPQHPCCLRIRLAPKRGRDAMTSTILLLQFASQNIALFCCALFAGAATYVSLVEHPAADEAGTELADISV